MKILKFGGTSVGSAERFKEVARLVQRENGPVIVVLSAMSGTTNTLVQISELLKQKKTEESRKVIQELHQKYKQVVSELFTTENYKQQAQNLLSDHFTYLEGFLLDVFTSNKERAILLATRKIPFC